MRLTLLYQNRMLFVLILAGCLLFDFFLYLRRRRGGGVVWQAIGSNFFILYLTYRVTLQTSLYAQYPQYFTFWSWVNWSLVMLVFLSYAISYLIRMPAVTKAVGWRETVFPLFCAILPVTLYETEALGFPLFFQRMPGGWNGFSLSFLLVGNLITILGFWSLGRAFSIFMEAREHKTTGLYRYIRHPIYLGESVATVGCCLQVPSWINIGITLLWLGLQRRRATFEEKKLERTFPSYRPYREMTGAYFPRWYRRNN